MAFVPVPKDLNRVKTKVMFNLTKRQLICFALAAAAGVPVFFLTKPGLGISTSAMLMAGPHRAATGEFAVVGACRTAVIIVGPLGIVIADAMLGEVTPAMAAAVGQSRAKRVLIPFSHCDNIVAGVPELATGALIQCAVRSVTALAGELADGPLESSEGRA